MTLVYPKEMEETQYLLCITGTMFQYARDRNKIPPTALLENLEIYKISVSYV